MSEEKEHVVNEVSNFVGLDAMDKIDEERLNQIIDVSKKAVTDTDEWQRVQKQEYTIGPDNFFDELMAKKTLSKAEMMWMVRRMMYFYGREDPLLKKAPIRSLMMNMNSVLRVVFLLLDHPEGELDDNMRSYLSGKIQQATWGINANTRPYLAKLNGRDREIDPNNPPVYSL